MTRPQFRDVARRVSLYGNLLMGVTGSVVVALAYLFAWWISPLIGGCGVWLRCRLQNEAVAGLIGGLVVGVVSAPLLLLSLGPFLWVDRQFGVRCPGCRRSVTLRCLHSRVLQTGKCCLCQEPLFKPTRSDVAAEPLNGR
jgi:hypothetical protein